MLLRMWKRQILMRLQTIVKFKLMNRAEETVGRRGKWLLKRERMGHIMVLSSIIMVKNGVWVISHSKSGGKTHEREQKAP